MINVFGKPTAQLELANAFNVFETAKAKATHAVELAEKEIEIEDAVLKVEHDALEHAKKVYAEVEQTHQEKIKALDSTITKANKLSTKISDFLD